MLKELSRRDWLSLLNLPEAMVPRILILRGTRNLKAGYEKHKTYFKDVRELNSPNDIFEDIFIGTHDDTLFGYASVYGDAMASEVVHLFGVLGTRIVIQTGCCGALAENMLPGDIVCPTFAYCGEGASRYYLPGHDKIEASSELVDSIKSSEVAPLTLHKGPVWTTSALLAEGKAEIQKWREQGFIAVDMETAATFSVAKYFKMKRLSLLFVFDNPGQGGHLLLTDAQQKARRLSGEQTIIDLALNFGVKS